MRKHLEWIVAAAMVGMVGGCAYMIGFQSASLKYGLLLDRYEVTVDEMSRSLHFTRDSVYAYRIRDITLGCAITLPEPLPYP